MCSVMAPHKELYPCSLRCGSLSPNVPARAVRALDGVMKVKCGEEGQSYSTVRTMHWKWWAGTSVAQSKGHVRAK